MLHLYCQRDGAPYILEDLKKLPIPVVQVTTDIISNSKQQDKDLLEVYRELHQETALEIKTLAIIRNNNSNLSDILKKKKKPSKKQREARTKREQNCDVPVGHIWKFDLERSKKHLILE